MLGDARLATEFAELMLGALVLHCVFIFLLLLIIRFSF